MGGAVRLRDSPPSAFDLFHLKHHLDRLTLAAVFSSHIHFHSNRIRSPRFTPRQDLPCFEPSPTLFAGSRHTTQSRPDRSQRSISSAIAVADPRTHTGQVNQNCYLYRRLTEFCQCTAARVLGCNSSELFGTSAVMNRQGGRGLERF